ncbi:MAG: hypothetical protein M1816_007716 [Peltula sp. TS41687]|nr:MAG: hypothetical protein M1816_007716 [Peltula sp. TS41687]
MALSKVSISRNRFIVLLVTGLILLTVALLVGYPRFSREGDFPVHSVLEKFHGDPSSSNTLSKPSEQVPADPANEAQGEAPAQTHPAVERPRVVAIVFYGRRDRVSILHCYLQKNLAINGGVLDEVQFIVKTEDTDDLKWLDKAIAKTPGYTKVTVSTGSVDYKAFDFSNAWESIQRDTLYIKIDDDVVFIHEDAIPHLVETKLKYPKYLAVSANVVNSPLISYIHYHLGASRPFLPELTPPSQKAPGGRGAWKTSELPMWDGPENFTMTLDTEPPFKGHRWLPLGEGRNTDDMPIALVEYNSFGTGWNKWAIAAQEHYSFLMNLEEDPHLDVYRYRIWETIYDRLSINFLAIMGNDILDNGPVPAGDEEYFTQVLPKKLGRHIAIDGNAVVAHYSFGPQISHEPAGLGWTDILDRYRAYSEEKVCNH